MLHGEVKLNGEVRFTWRARRLDADQVSDGHLDYQVSVIAHREGREVRAILPHLPGDGTLALTRKVLAWAEEQGLKG